MNRVTVFAKGNVDVFDSLHSCRIGGEVRWNGINEIVRDRYPGSSVRLQHETFTRSDALLEAPGQPPEPVAARALNLGSHPANSQFSAALFETRADAIVLSAQADVTWALVRHRRAGFLLYPSNLAAWSDADRDWLRQDFDVVEMLDVDHSMANLEQIIERIRARSHAPVLIYNLSPFVPGELVHCFQGLEDIYSTRIRRFNLGLISLSERTGVSIIDVEGIIARAGAERLKLDVVHYTPEGYRLIAEEVVRVLADLALFPAAGEA